MKRFAGGVLTSPVLRWTWNEAGDHAYKRALGDFRPSDIETVSEMAAGRYLLGGKLVDTGGISPFAAEVDHPGWHAELHEFAWLRHFADIQDEGLRRFARTLVLDWIGRYGQKFDPEIWSLDLMARRALNWMRHLNVLELGASAGQRRTIHRALARQVRSLNLRTPYACDPLDRLMMRIVTLAASLCEDRSSEVVARDFARLDAEIALQFDETGMHKSRSAAVQLEVLTDLVTIRQAMARRDQVHLGALPARMARMHVALSALVLGNGELGFFNGTGQEPSDLLYAVQATDGGPKAQSGIIGGYGVLRTPNAVVIADPGFVPEPDFATRAHAGALSFEFSHNTELIVGNCGPAPAELRHQNRLFRLGPAHSAPTIDHHSAARIMLRGANAGALVTNARPPEIELDDKETALKMTSHAFEGFAGVTLERWLTLLMGGDALVGQDRINAGRSGIAGKEIILRFHLGPGIEAEHRTDEDIIHLRLPSGRTWSFLWEGATASLDESVRQSSYFGLYKTRQIILTAPLSDGLEIAWILTRLA